MKLIVGLGNPGEKYQNTRHNLGFIVIEHLLKALEPVTDTNWQHEKKLKCDIVILPEDHHEKIILCKPQTYMNNSGLAVSLVKDYYNVSPEDIWVLHDEIDLPVGSMKIRFGGGSAGHHGIESIMEHIGTEKFWRFRLGIGVSHKFSGNDQEESRKPLGREKIHNVEEFVISEFDHHDKGKIRELIKRAVKALELGLSKDLKSAMNRYNTK